MAISGYSHSSHLLRVVVVLSQTIATTCNQAINTYILLCLNSYRCILYLQSLILTYSPIRSITDEFDHLEVISAELLLFFSLTSASLLQKLGPCLLCSLICVQSTLASNDAYIHGAIFIQFKSVYMSHLAMY